MKIKNKTKKSTEELIEDLARMTKEGFERTTSELSGVKNELEQVVKRLDRIEYGMISHERRLSILEDKMRIVSVKLGLKR